MKDVFDRASATYDLVGPPMFSILACLAAPLIPRSVGQRVVEVGCGTGALTRHLRPSAGQLVATDLSTRMLARCPAGLGRVAADALRLPLRDGWADLVVAAHVVQLLADAGAAVQEWARVLRPLGTLVVIKQLPPAEPAWAAAVAALLPPRTEARSAWSHPAAADELLAAAGLGPAEHTTVDLEVVFESGEQFWQWCWSTAQRRRMEELSEGVGRLHAAVVDTVNAACPHGAAYPLRHWVAVARPQPRGR